MITRKITVLDGYTLNPGDLNWAGLQSLGECTIYDRTPEQEIVERAIHAEIILTNKVPLTKEILKQLPNLKYIGVLATGYNIVNVTAAKEKNIIVTNIPAYSTPSVAQFVFALVLELTHHIGDHAHAVKNGRWNTNPDFSFWNFPLAELKGKTFGIIGFGNIGKAVAKIATAFEMNVFVSTRSRQLPDNVAGSKSDIEFTDLDTLFTFSDIISLHAALTDETRHLVNAERLAFMKPSAYLINTARGDLIDEKALANALNNGQLAGAGLDVLSQEPPTEGNPLITAKNCIITPHIAWATLASRQRLMELAVHNVRSFIEGYPVNVVSS